MFASLSSQTFAFPSKPAELKVIAAAFEVLGFKCVEDFNGADVGVLDSVTKLGGRERALARKIIVHASTGFPLLGCVLHFCQNYFRHT